MHKRFWAAAAIAGLLAAGAATAKPRNGELGVYLDDAGNVVGSYSVSCEGVFSYEGTRTANAVANGQLVCNGPD
ncbi:hypothetical protein LDO32_06475 [Luteimonas sp. Y-2-2-4F]|nr:DUF6289 family protein [Luteimonas sp. Y-2-2-4F]MCD9031371.1 hypothetical protein [Luteimonas sp. Y-2-2-4F]